jgi:hypothetical protein
MFIEAGLLIKHLLDMPTLNFFKKGPKIKLKRRQGLFLTLSV